LNQESWCGALTVGISTGKRVLISLLGYYGLFDCVWRVLVMAGQ